jgi:hypothetical protein
MSGAPSARKKPDASANQVLLRGLAFVGGCIIIGQMSPERRLDLPAFRATLPDDAPPSGLGLPLLALWWSGKGQWNKAHKLVQDDESGEGAWVHAYLHRLEGDPSNAEYWYRRAGRSVPHCELDVEWAEIADTLLKDPG